jgi:hypothetical protein
MKINKVLVCSALMFLIPVTFDALGEDNKQISLESLIGTYEGVIQVDKTNPIEHYYTTEVLSIDKLANTVSLKAYCTDCAVKEFERNACNITEVNETVKFSCKHQKSLEEYTFNGDSLRATGFGINYPYSIKVTKIFK